MEFDFKSPVKNGSNTSGDNDLITIDIFYALICDNFTFTQLWNGDRCRQESWLRMEEEFATLHEVVGYR
jgi:hypothetical protein